LEHKIKIRVRDKEKMDCHFRGSELMVEESVNGGLFDVGSGW